MRRSFYMEPPFCIACLCTCLHFNLVTVLLSGSAIEIGCKPGTYQPNMQQANCSLCEVGFHCPYNNMTSTIPCGRGFYCPGGDTIGVKCPAGTYNNKTGAKLASDCIDCPKGFYCLEGSIQPTGRCQEGYFCQGAAKSRAPNVTSIRYPLNGPCAAGYYCVEGTAAPVGCPEGTYRSSVGAARESDCSACEPGYYCKGTGLTASTTKCSGGWYCVGGNKSPTPSNATCWAGYYCPLGTGTPFPCPPGRFIFIFGDFLA